MKFRYDVKSEDCEKIRQLIIDTDFFNKSETAIAVELVIERISKGTESGYYFVIAEQSDTLIGYTCYGNIPCTKSSFDLYWIAVSPDFQRRGIGRKLVEETENRIKKSGGTRIYIETSNRDQYKSTREFYNRCNYQLVSVLEDFYAPGDSKATYCKAL